MKPKNFPGRKLARKLLTRMRQGDETAFASLEDLEKQVDEARKIRTKKKRG